MRAVIFSGDGRDEVVRLVDMAPRELEPHEVRVRVRFAAINALDLARRNGVLGGRGKRPDVYPGIEVAGVVEECGSTAARWTIGSSVIGLVGAGGLAELVATSETLLAPSPARLLPEQAAAIPESFVVAHDAISTCARLAEEEVIVIHRAAGGVGTAAIQISHARGALPYAVVRHASGKQIVENLGAVALDEDCFVESTLKTTSDNGVDVILELVGSVHFPDNFKIAARRARIILLSGAAADEHISVSLRSLMVKRLELHGSTMASRTNEELSAAIVAFSRDALPMFDDGRLKPPVIDSIFPAAQAIDAFNRLETPSRHGKVLIEF